MIGSRAPLAVAAVLAPTVALPLALTVILACAPADEPHIGTTIALRDGWSIAAAAEVTAEPEALSTSGFDSSSWTSTHVPSTVVAALFHAGEIDDPYFGDNLERIDAAPFEGPWWYRTEFTLEGEPTPHSSLVLEGINYRADVWLNGAPIAKRDDLFGSFRMWKLDVTDTLVEGTNALALLVYPPQPGDPTLGFVDWNPTSPDENMGLWRGVQLERTGDVSLDDVFVRSDVDLETLDRASLTLTATLTNRSDRSLGATVSGTIGGGIAIEQEVTLEPGEERRVVFSPERFEALAIENPRLWWPHDLGTPELYDLELTVRVDGKLSDREEVTFGIREVSDYLTEEGHRGYAVNGKRLLLRGGGWVDDMLLADSDRKVEDQLRYVRHMNLNLVRLEGFWGSNRTIYEVADRLGLLVMVGWSCQWEWEEYLGGPVDEFGGIDTPEEIDLVASSLRDQVLWLRNHPSVLVWALASDALPRPELERRYYAELDEVDPTRPTLVSCARDTSEVSGPSGAKMLGPYDWVAPNYWTLDRERGGAYGFNTETGPGPQPPPIDSIRRMLPEEHWWPIDEMWHYHCGRHNFNTLDRYREALDARYGPTDSLEEFARLSQVANYEAMRAMFEAFSIRRPATTGLIQWMLNSAWPEMYWQLYDHYLVPNGAFYGARDAARPIHVAYDYADRGLVAVNDTRDDLAGASLRVRVFDLDSQRIHEERHPLDLAAETLRRVTTLPPIETDGKAYFVDLRILDADGTELVTNLYWLSTEKDVFDWDASEWFVTPMKSYADLTGLARMPEVELDVEHAFTPTADGYELEVTLSNPSDRIAFFIEGKIMDPASDHGEWGRRAAPVLWSDNYISLLPGETREIRATIPAHALGGAPSFHYAGINVTGE